MEIERTTWNMAFSNISCFKYEFLTNERRC